MNNNKSIKAVRCESRCHFNIHRNQSVPTHKTIIRWVNAFRTQGSLLDKRSVGSPQTVRTPENVERVRQAMLWSPNRSPLGHSIKPDISNRSVRRILHEDQHLNPYKLVVGGARGVMVIVVGNGHDDTSSNPGRD